MRAPVFKPVYTVMVDFETEAQANDFAYRLEQAREQGQLAPLKSSLLMTSLKNAKGVQVEKVEQL